MKTLSNHCLPVFVVGAPRSGKKLMSEILGRHPEVCSFEDELTFLWRHGHGASPMDSLRPEQLTDEIANYVHQAFERARNKSDAKVIVDRTDHNVVRLPYVKAVFPNCRVIHVVRDARGSVASQLVRRSASPNLRELIRKARTVPLSDLFRVGAVYSWDVLQASFGSKRHRKRWGIRTAETVETEQTSSLVEKSATQWQQCVRYGVGARAQFDDDNYLLIRYEDIVADPQAAANRAFEFVGLSSSSAIDQWLAKNVFSSSIHSWKQQLDAADLSSVERICKAEMQDLGYVI